MIFATNLRMPTKILIIRFSSIGDIVLTTPVPRCIKKRYPNAEIHYATKVQYTGLLEANPYIDKIHTLEDKKLPNLIQRLDDEKFDLIIDLHNNLRSFLIRTNLGIENRIFNKLNFQKWLMVNFKINRLPQQHIVDRYLATLKDFEVVNDEAGLDYFIPEKDEVDIAVLPEQFKAGFIAFVIGAMHNTKKLPINKAIELCSKIKLPIVLIGGKDDYETGEAIIAGTDKVLFNACGKFNLNQSASLIRQSVKVVAHDTGMMHIAAALKKEIFSVWGNTIPEFGMYPYYGSKLTLDAQRLTNHVLEVNGLICRPCSKIGFDTCPKGHFKCMQQLDLSGFEA